MSHINTIIFYLGGVLIDWNPEYLYKQILAHETGIPEVSDPLAGSYYIEELTKQMYNNFSDDLKRTK